LIGTTSAITGQVVGHVKTCLIIAGGFVFYPPANFSIRDVKNIMGILIAIVGMILYGHIKVVDGKRLNGEQVHDCLDSCLPDLRPKVDDEEERM
jgi:solute carrier family 35, member E3